MSALDIVQNLCSSNCAFHLITTYRATQLTQQTPAASMHAHPLVLSISDEQGQVNSGADNPEVDLGTLIVLSLHDGFKNPGYQPTE